MEGLKLYVQKLMKEQRGDPLDIVFNLPEAYQKPVAEALLQTTVEDGRAHEAQRVLEILGREFTEEEIETLARASIHSFQTANIRSFAINLPEEKRVPILEEALKKDLSIGEIHSAKITAEFLGRKLRVREIEKCLRVYQKRDSSWTRAAISAAKLLPPKKKTAVIEKIIKNNVEGGYLQYALDGALELERQLTAAELETALKDRLERGYLSEAQSAARHLNISLSPATIESILEKCVSLGYFSQARDAASLLGRDLTICELNRLLKNMLQWKDPFSEEKVTALLIAKLRAREDAKRAVAPQAQAEAELPATA